MIILSYPYFYKEGAKMETFDIVFYKNQSENKDVVKILTDEYRISGKARSDIDIMSPVIGVKGNDIINYNYCYIEELKRYYYITNYKSLAKDIIELYLKIDVLMTYKEDIKASSGLIRKQRDYNPYYGDIEAENRKTIDKYNLENPFNTDGNFILVSMKGFNYNE